MSKTKLITKLGSKLETAGSSLFRKADDVTAKQAGYGAIGGGSLLAGYDIADQYTTASLNQSNAFKNGQMTEQEIINSDLPYEQKMNLLSQINKNDESQTKTGGLSNASPFTLIMLVIVLGIVVNYTLSNASFGPSR